MAVAIRGSMQEARCWSSVRRERAGGVFAGSWQTGILGLPMVLAEVKEHLLPCPDRDGMSNQQGNVLR